MWSNADFDEVFAAADPARRGLTPKSPPERPMRQPAPELPAHTATTRWHWIVMLAAVPASVVLQVSVPISFESIFEVMGKERAPKPGQLPWLFVLSIGVPHLLVPFLVPVMRRKHVYYRHVCFVSFLMMALSCIVSASSKETDLVFFTFAVIYGGSSSLLLTVQIVILSDYFPPGHPHHVAGTTFSQVGSMLSAVLMLPLIHLMTQEVNWKDGMLILASFIGVTGIGVALLFRPIGAKGVATHSERNSSESSRSSVSDAYSDENGSDYDAEEGVRKYVAVCSLKDCRRKWQMYPWLAAMVIHFLWEDSLMPHIHRLTQLITNKNPEIAKNNSSNDNVLISYHAGSALCVIIFSVVGRFLRERLNIVHIAGTFFSAFIFLLLNFVFPTYPVILMLCFVVGFGSMTTKVYYYPASYEVLRMDLATGYTVSLFFGGIGTLMTPLISHLMVERYTEMCLMPAAVVCLVIEGLLQGATLFLMYWTRSRDDYEEM